MAKLSDSSRAMRMTQTGHAAESANRLEAKLRLWAAAGASSVRRRLGRIVIFFFTGWGRLVPLAALLSAVVSYVVVTPIASQSENVRIAAIVALTGMLSGGSLYLLVKKLEPHPRRVLIDERTKKKVRVGPSAGSFMFIPTRVWMWVLPAVSTIISWAVLSQPAANG
jgi:hypothetical protein